MSHNHDPAVCQFCGNQFMARRDQRKIGKGIYCSNRCAQRSRVSPILEFIDQSNGANACWPWRGYIEPHGYGRVVRSGKRMLAHRAVYEELIGPVLPEFDLLHSCDNPICCNPRHLSPGMHIHNMADMARKGRTRPLRGEAKPGAKLNTEKVLIARRRLAAGEACTSIARSFGVSSYTIFDIKRGKSWKHVP